jgi:hypothetical protein
MYLAWNQADVGILTAPCTGLTQPSGGGNAAPVWGDGFLLRDQSANVPTPRGAGSDVCATSLGSQAFLLAYPIDQSGQPAVFIGLYYVADQTTTMVATKAGSFAAWNARASVVLTTSAIAAMSSNPDGMDMYDTGSTVSIVTIPYVTPGSGASDNQLSLALVGFMTIEMDQNQSSGGKTGKFWWPMQFMLPLDETGAPLVSGAPAPQTIWTAGMRPKSNATAVCDPAGRIVCCAASQDWPTENLKELFFGVFQTYTMPPSLAPDGFVTVAPSAANPQPPALLFVVGAGTPSSATTNVTGNGQMTPTTYPVYLFAFYASSTVAQLIDYGAIEVTNNYALGNPVSAQGPTLATFGIIDGPIPVPNQNIAGWQFESTTNDLGSIAYGNQVNSGIQTAKSWNYNIGFQTSGSITFKGLGQKAGIAWDASFSGGQTRNWGSSTASTLANTLQQTADVNPKKTGGGTHTNQVGVGIDPWGSVWAAQSGVSFNNFRFVNAAGLVISDGSIDAASQTPLAPVQGSCAPSLAAPTQYLYVPYMVTPGNLLSYTIDGEIGINATMAKLAGVANYFETIIWPAAFTFTAGSDTQKYLLFSWEVGGVTGQGFSYVTGTVNTQSWQINASFYVGWTWGSTEGFPLIGTAMTQGSFMIGGSGGYSSSTTTTTSDQWGVAIAPPPGSSPPFGPPNWGEAPTNVDPSLQNLWGAAVAKYEFALFLLPDPGADAPAPLSPGYWVRELIQYGNLNATTVSPAAVLPTDLDPNIGCWKIVYIVLSIWTNDDLNSGTPTYCYDDPYGWFGGSRCPPT